MNLALHHIGYLVAEIDPGRADWVRRFGLEVESPVVEDPAQTALVQFLRAPGAPYWIELVAPNGPESKLSAALKGGGGLHHLCYEVEDIEAGGRHLRSTGMFPVSRPTPAVAFGGRRISWFLDARRLLIELVEAGREGPLRLGSIGARAHRGGS